jgi:hypothetical protein
MAVNKESKGSSVFENLDIKYIKDFSHDFDYSGAVCRVHSTVLRHGLKRNAWYCIENNENKKKIFRRFKGINSSGFSKEHIELDYDSRLELMIAEKNWDESKTISCDFTVKKTTLLQRLLIANWIHPDYTHKISYRYAVIGCGLGIIGLFLGIISLF